MLYPDSTGEILAIDTGHVENAEQGLQATCRPSLVSVQRKQRLRP
jgi:hypothetical protein